MILILLVVIAMMSMVVISNDRNEEQLERILCNIKQSGFLLKKKIFLKKSCYTTTTMESIKCGSENRKFSLIWTTLHLHSDQQPVELPRVKNVLRWRAPFQVLPCEGSQQPPPPSSSIWKWLFHDQLVFSVYFQKPWHCRSTALMAAILFQLFQDYFVLTGRTVHVGKETLHCFCLVKPFILILAACLLVLSQEICL